ncbi:MAG: hypothetical protein LBP59_03385 [Planctomycetaceae bacterium]|nr:hypothetical protein [Planctomycetaceae bacterium]
MQARRPRSCDAGVSPANLKEHRRNACDSEMQARPPDRGRLVCDSSYFFCFGGEVLTDFFVYLYCSYLKFSDLI